MSVNIEQSVWPSPLVENFESDQWPKLDFIDNDGHLDSRRMRKWVYDKKQIRIRCITWNLCAKPPPPSNQLLTQLLPLNKFHLIFFGTEECERSIAQSALNPSKKAWESYLSEAVGPNYIPIRSHTLQAIHLIVFAHQGIAHHCSFATSAAVATGAGNTLGNKGAVALYLLFGTTKILVINAHLAAHQHAEGQRNSDFTKISRSLPSLLEKKEATYIMSLKRTSWVGGPSKRLSDGSSPVISNRVSYSNKESHNASGSNLMELVGAARGEDSAVEGSRSQPSIEGDSSDDDSPSPAVNLTTGTAGQLDRERDRERESDVASEASSSTVLDDGKIATGNVRTSSSNNLARMSSIRDTSSGSLSFSSTRLEEKTIDQYADAVIFMGDLNYRIKGNRAIVTRLLESDMHEVLITNDQLRINMERGNVLQNFKEPPLNFRPTYKLDVGTDIYDTGPKNRIPAWTDRILYVDSGRLTCLAYNADFSVSSSDHKPVYASFSLAVDFDETFLQQELSKLSLSLSLDSSSQKNQVQIKDRDDGERVSGSSSSKAELPKKSAPDSPSASNREVEELTQPQFSSESQVCNIM